MAGQSMERRDVLRIMALAAAASGAPGFHRWVFACDHGGAGVAGGASGFDGSATGDAAAGLEQSGAPAQAARYAPRFFTADEYATVERLTELIIPTDDTPGAREAGVSEFVDFMIFSTPAEQYAWRYGLTWLDMHAQRLHGQTFRLLEAGAQTSILEHLAYAARHRAGEEEGRAFFREVRRYTIMGFYTSRIGLEQLDYPGLRIYGESPGCPHPDDPEHRRLVAPAARA